ncbi:retrovirus-related pol polyprotein from transposon TNT 1-94 [Tanacetum coccineum]
MRVECINGKKYILVIMDDYLRFTWVKILRSRDETTEFIIKFLKQVQVHLNAIVRNIRTDSGTEFVNQTMKSYYEDVRKPDLKYFHVFGALCYPTNDSEDLGKPKPKADIGLIQNPVFSTPYFPPIKKDRDILFQPMSDEYFQPSPSFASRVPPTVAFIPADTTGTPSSTSIDQDAPSASTSPTTQEIQSPVIHQGIEEQLQPKIFNNDPFINIFNQEPSFEESSSRDVISSDLQHNNQPFDPLRKWTKDHPLDKVIGNPSRPVSTRRQLQTDSIWCYFDAFLTKVEPKNFKEALKESCWIEAMQEQIHEFD